MKNKQPPFQITNKIIDEVAEISELTGRLSAHDHLSSNPNLRRTNRIRTIHGSLAIEQNTLSLEQVTAVLNMYIPTSRLLRIITCHTSSLFYVTACHMTRCIVKTAAPVLFRAVVSSCKASQIFFHILILRKASIMSPMCSGCGGMRPSRIAPRQEKDTTKVVSFSFLKFFIFLLDK